MKNFNKRTPFNINPGKVDLAWDRYVNCGELPKNSIRKIVSDSWARCLEDGVDPSSSKTRLSVNDKTYQTLLKDNAQLVEAAKPVMEHARNLLAGSGSMMILADKNGICLHVEGDRKTVEDGHDIRLAVRANWSERAAGTNAIGTVLSVGMPIQINTTEHFCEGIKSWTCTAMVIREPGSQEIIGALDLSGLTSDFNYHTQALVVEAAGRIESRLMGIRLEEKNRLLNAAVSIFSSPTNDALMLLDNYGCLVKANENVASNLAMRGVELKNNGKNFIYDINSRESKMLEAEWLRNEWIEPVMEGQDQLGNMLIIPSPHAVYVGTSKNTVSSSATLSDDRKYFEDIVGSSTALKKTINKAQRLATLPVPILIQGETGVGKEMFAKAIHAAGPNSKGPLITLNCGGLSRDLITSELFGYVEGAFTGAVRGGKKGKIEAADGGTLFLDEIGELPLDIQANFLRVLQEGEICRLGDHQQRKVNFRVLVATNRDLNLDVKEGLFRMDLFYRISVITLSIPSLREREKDVEMLMHFFAGEIAKRDGVDQKQFSPGFIKALKSYEWPGNIRELRNIVECSVLMCQTDTVTLEDLPGELQNKPEGKEAGTLLKDVISNDSNISLEDAERLIIISAIKSNNGNLTKTANHLGMAKSTLYLKLKKHGLDRNSKMIQN
ncbi:MAG: sigma-54-dependent Fis family transcriptional regulator [marine bacterium B5-7]|nr:MAG: sigma-54-dependent Fis family transcriptional regulator [marine bacterium B5-7]